MFASSLLIGLDITGRTFRAVAVRAKNKKLLLEGYSELSVPENVLRDGTIIDQARGALLLRQLTDALPHHLGTHSVHVALPERKTFIKLVEFPPISTSDLATAVRQSIIQHIPFPIDEVYLDWKILRNQRPQERVRVLVGAVEKSIADNLVAVLKLAGLTPLSFAIESIATASSLVASEEKSPKPLMIVDIGSEQATAIVYDHGAVQFSSAIPFSDQAMTLAIQNAARLKPADAAKAKRICGLDPRRGKGKVRKILLPVIRDLAEALQQTSNYYKNGFSNGQDVKQFTLVGSGSYLIGLTDYLSEKLAAPVTLGNPLAGVVENKLTRGMTAERTLEFATAIGLTISAKETA